MEKISYILLYYLFTISLHIYIKILSLQFFNAKFLTKKFVSKKVIQYSK